MNSDLAVTGTAALLEFVAPFVPDDFITECWPTAGTGGKRRAWRQLPVCAAKLKRPA